MPASDITKRIFADGIKELMKTSALAKISVSDIATHCNISRNTFYYHFKDKFDLINWIFKTEVTAVISDITDLTHWNDGLVALCRYMQANRRFYLNALHTQGQNSFADCLMTFYQALIQNMLEDLNPELQLTAFDLQIVSRFYAHSLVGLILDWAKDGMKTDPEPVISIMTEIINGNMFNQAISIKAPTENSICPTHTAPQSEYPV